MNTEIISAGPEDLPALEKLAEKVWKHHYSSIISNEQIEYMLEKFNSTEPFKKQIAEGHRIHLVKANDQLIGYISESNENETDFFLHKFYIDAEYQGKGLGKNIFNRIFNSIPSIKNLRLTVNRKNFKSINFYFSLGFIIEDVADFDIGEGYFMNDFVMLKKFGLLPQLD